MAVFLAVAGGLAFGVGSYTFVYAKGFSYMGNDPATCANCHIMQDQYNGWQKSSHHTVAVCNDCHTPHNFLGKYFVKGLNGYHHSKAFTTGRFHEPIQIKAMNRGVTESACRYCHGDVVQAIDEGRSPTCEDVSCIRCHASVGHME
jgi:cytochrome c nitrite reductase small subunit